MGRRTSHVIGIGVVLALAGAAALGITALWRYEGQPGQSAAAPAAWPLAVTNTDQAKLIVALHPRCPCSRATVGELARIMTQCQGKLTATVLMVRPEGVEAGWEKTDLWANAAAIPGVTVVADENGNEARRFGAKTSGQVLLYGGNGQLLFAGGITEGRGHAGDNAGESEIISLVYEAGQLPMKKALWTPVYGCALFDNKCEEKGSAHVAGGN